MWGATVLRGTRPISPSRISIHAPRVGRDRRQRTRWSRPSIFQSTRPVWGATAIRGARARAEAISIHAPRVGRDKGRGENLVVTLDISIHAPRVGRDCGRHHTDDRAKRFQSTRPVWGATRARLTSECRRRISIHAPRVGRDARWRVPACGTSWISIHAPRVGRDAACENQYPAGQHFNPRAPCGARQHRKLRLLGALRFQSTRPVWGATIVTLDKVAEMTISIHAPRVGRDQRCGRFARAKRHFNPRAPCGARRQTHSRCL